MNKYVDNLSKYNLLLKRALENNDIELQKMYFKT